MLGLLEAGFLAFWANNSDDAMQFIDDHSLDSGDYLAGVALSRAETIKRLRAQGIEP
jgi:hypothetical protein